MQQKDIKRFLQSWVINTLAVLVAVYLVEGLRFKDRSLWTPFITSLVLGILNAFIRPMVMLLALPLLIFTLGFFMLVINAVMLYVVGLLLGAHFEVEGFGSAFLGALIISIVSLVLNTLAGTGKSRVQITRHHRRESRDDKDGGDGPVIDI